MFARGGGLGLTECGSRAEGKRERGRRKRSRGREGKGRRVLGIPQ